MGDRQLKNQLFRVAPYKTTTDTVEVVTHLIAIEQALMALNSTNKGDE